MSEAGRPSELNDALTFRIRKLVLESVSHREIQKILEISPDTWDGWVWRNYQGFRDNLNAWKKERMVKIAEANIETLMFAENDKIKLDASTFTLETLAKADYSKRAEMTGKDGEKLEMGVVILPAKNGTNGTALGK